MNLKENSVPRNKAWQEPWTTDEIRNNASNWSLAGDAGLLLFMENFSNNLVSKISETLENIDSLSENVSNTQIKLNNVTNHFMSLNHTQFIENRVYEEDETADTYNSSKNSQKKDEINTSNQTDKLELMCKAVEKSLGILNTHFERVDISDSEDDSGEASSTIYNLKDPYSDRSLPYALGSELWHAKDHIGLQHSESTESINEQNDLETDEKSNSLKNYKSVLDYLSDSGSDLEFSLPIDSAKAENNGTYSNEVEKDLFTSTSNSDFDVPVKENKKVEATANMNFVEELAAKLGNVVAATNQSKTPEVIKSKSDTKKEVSGQYEQNMFSDEPPPMDQFDKSLQANEYTEGGLFDDLDDPLWGMSYKDDEDTGTKQNVSNNKTGQKPKIDSLFENKADEDDLFAEINKKITERETSKTITSTPDEKSKATSVPSKGLFDDSDSDDLFKIPDNANQIKLSNASETTGDSLSYLEKEETKRKKLVGEKSLFAGQSDLFNQNINKLLKESKLLSPKKKKDNEINEPIVEKEKEVIPPETKIQKSKSVDIFEDEKIDQPNRNKKIMSLFEDDDDDMFDFLIKKDVKKAPNANSNDSTKNVEKDSMKITSTGDNKNEKPTESKSSSVKNEEETTGKDKKNTKDDFISNLSSNIFNDEPPEIDEDKSEFDDQYERDFSEPKLGFMQSNSSQMYFDEPPPLNDHLEGSSGIGTETSSNRLQDDNDLFQPTLNSTAKIVKDEKENLFDGINSKLSTTKTFDNKQKSNISNLFDDNNSDDIFSICKKPSNNLLSVEANNDLFSNINTVEKTDKSKVTISSIFEDEDDIFKEIRKDDNVKRNNIIEESLFKSFDAGDNLFSNVQNSNIIDEMLNRNNKKIIDEKNSNDSTKSQPKNSSENIVSAFLNKIESKTDEVDGNKQSVLKSPPGKIKHNLNINVAALAPGATFVKPNIEKSVDLNSSVGNVETLPVAAHKERVRIPVKRRPSTRQARQKSIRNSGTDFLPTIPDDTDSNIVKNEFLPHSNEDNFCTECANIETENAEVIDSPILNTYLHLAESENINNINIQNEIERNNAAANMVENIVAEERSTEDTSYSKNDNGNLVTAEQSTKDESNTSNSRDSVKKHVANILFEDDNDSLFSSNLQTKEDDIFASIKKTKNELSDEDDDIFKSLSKEKVTLKKDTEQTVKDNIKNNQEKNITETKKEEKKLVFDDLLSEDDDLFKNKSACIKKETKKVVSNMFLDEDDDLFSAKSSSFSREKVNKASSSMEKEMKNKPKKMSLFNDDDEDLDIFGSSSKSSKTFQSNAPVIQPNRPKKPVAEFVSNDPLSLLHSDDE